MPFFLSGPPEAEGAIAPGRIVRAEIVESHDFDLTALI